MFNKPELSAGNRPYVDTGLRSGNYASQAPRHSSARGVFPYVESTATRERRQVLAAKMRAKLRSKQTGEDRVPEILEPPELEFSLGNQELPAWNKKSEILQAVRENQVTIIIGPTGSGKSTQVPQFLVDGGFDQVILTQPRIMAANGVAERVADELESSFGEERARNLVAIQTSERFDRQEEAKIVVRTDGLEQVMQLERYLAGLKYDEQQEISGKTVLVLDEIHESNVNMVGLQALVLEMTEEYPSLRVVVMSATMDALKYQTYYGDNGKRLVPVVEVEGRPAEVTWSERPDADAIQVIRELVEEGDKLDAGDDILLFTSGKREIQDLIQKGTAAGLQLEFVGLHAGMTAEQQASAVAEHPNTVRVIVSTDVAMSSLTFPHLKYVIDEGIVKNPELDAEGVGGLVTQLCSQAEIRQRGGRAGRVRAGFHILVRPHEETGEPFLSFDKRAEYPEPPIFSTDLSRNVLQFASYGIDFEKLRLIDKVDPKKIRDAKDKLYNLGATDEQDAITEVGKRMNTFPIGTEYSRMIVEAMKPGVSLNVLVNTIMVASAYEAGGLRDFTGNYEKGKEPWRRRLSSPGSDAMAELQLFHAAGAIPSENESLGSQGYDVKNLARARKALRKSMHRLGLSIVDTPILKLNDEEKEEVLHAVASGFVENIYVRGRVDRHKYVYKSATGGGVSRELGSRSLVKSQSVPMVVGAPRYYIAQTEEGPKKIDIIENVQPLTLEGLARLDMRETLVPVDVVVRGGMIKVLSERRAGGLLRGTSERVPESGEIDEGDMLKAVLDHPGEAQGELRAIKRELEELQRLTRTPLKQLPQMYYEGVLLKAIRTSGSTEFNVIDSRLRTMMTEQGIRLEKYIDPNAAQRIRSAAVPIVAVNDFSVRLDYVDGLPVAKRLSPRQIAQLPDELSIPDGRRVLVRVPKFSKQKNEIVRGYQDVPVQYAKKVTRDAQVFSKRRLT